MATPEADDNAHMAAALSLARRGLGRVWPNPAVGCVLLKDGRVVGRGWTGAGGRPHAEAEALRRAGDAAAGATAYVTLEPCSHTGRTPPCADALVDAGIARAVIAVEDPDPRVSGAGLARLRAAGIEVAVGTGGEEAARINAGFFLRVTRGRPLVTLKTATSLDGRIATPAGESQWITAGTARAWGHGLRARHDAVAVGIGTAKADDPSLTCRLPGLADPPSPRIVFDGRLDLSIDSKLVRTAGDVPTWVVTREGADAARRLALVDRGVEVVEVAGDSEGRIDLAAALETLGARGLTRLLVEGGGRLAAGLLAAGLVDRIAWFRAGRLLGGDAVPAIGELALARLADAPAFVRESVRAAGKDLLETYRQAP